MAARLQASTPRSLLAAGARALVLAAPVWLAGCGGDPEMAMGVAPVEPLPAESSPEQRAQLTIFDETRVHKVKLSLSPEDWRSILEDSRGDEPRLATLSLDGVVIANVGVRPSGESSRVPGNKKISMRVDFDAFDQTKKLGGFDSIKLTGSWDDPFVIRDQLAYWYYRQFMPSPREVSAELWVNGETRGAFEIEEIWSKESLKRHFADASGTLYRIRGVGGMDPYEFVGTAPSLYVPLPWDAKGKHPPEAHIVIGEALRILKEEPARLNEALDVDNILTYFAISAILSNTDGFSSGFEVDDVYEYHDPTTGRFFMLPWDPDNTFGSINDVPTRDLFENFDMCRVTRLLKTTLRDQYFAKLDEVMRAMPVERVHAEVDRMAGQIRQVVHGDTLKMYPTEHFEWSLGYVKEFVSARYASVRQQIAPPQGP
jgi:hypothetical protein